jgi:hypothetical protein
VQVRKQRASVAGCGFGGNVSLKFAQLLKIDTFISSQFCSVHRKFSKGAQFQRSSNIQRLPGLFSSLHFFVELGGRIAKLRLDPFKLELLVKLQTIESPASLPASRLSPSEILRLVISTALACIATVLAGAWLWRH